MSRLAMMLLQSIFLVSLLGFSTRTSEHLWFDPNDFFEQNVVFGLEHVFKDHSRLFERASASSKEQTLSLIGARAELNRPLLGAQHFFGENPRLAPRKLKLNHSSRAPPIT